MDIHYLKILQSFKPDLKQNNISAGVNGNPTWKMLAEYAADFYAKSPDEKLIIDFKDCHVNNPSGSSEFKRMIAIPNVYMRLYDDKYKISGIVMAMTCLTGSSNTSNRVIQVNTPVKPAISEKDKQLIAKAKNPEWTKPFSINGNVGTYDLVKRGFTQFSSTETTKTVFKVFELAREEHPELNVLNIMCGNIAIAPHVRQALADSIVDMANMENPVRLNILTELQDVIMQISEMASTKKAGEYNIKARLNYIRKNVKPGFAGLLCRYRETKKLDRLGRQGDGIAQWVKPAIFKGINIENELVFDVYDIDTFTTHVDYAINNDNAALDGLDAHEEVINPMDCGLFNKYQGVKGHFILPVQHATGEANGTETRDSLNNKGSLVTKTYTSPELLKLVFDDWGISYNKEFLNRCINETNKRFNTAEKENSHNAVKEYLEEQ